MFKANKFMIATIRAQRNISQKDLAAKLKINRAVLSQIETGLILPSFELLLRIARELDCLVIDLYHKEDLEIMSK